MKKRSSVITFKTDDAMLEALERIPNKSEFIRAAILAALDESCPFCAGTGTLNPHQRQHWNSFLKEHTLEHCDECHELTFTCAGSHSKQKANNPGDTIPCKRLKS